MKLRTEEAEEAMQQLEEVKLFIVFMMEMIRIRFGNVSMMMSITSLLTIRLRR